MAMTAEERAEAAFDEMLDSDGGWGNEEDVAVVARAIRAAEDEALERAAAEIEKTLWTCIRGFGCDKCAAIRYGAAQIRSLKSGSVKGERDGR